MPRGGYRPGAGRPKGSTKGAAKKTAVKKSKPAKEKPLLQPEIPDDLKPEEFDPNLSPLDYLLNIMRSPDEEKGRRDRAASLLLPFCHVKPGEAGKKGEKEKAAKQAAAGRFSAPPPPLRAVK